jgi:predicted RNA-binding protein with PIN domain
MERIPVPAVAESGPLSDPGSGEPDVPAGLARLLQGLPEAVWHDLARRVRRALDDVETDAVPAPLRPFARWQPDRFAVRAPRQVVAEALAAEARLRRALADHAGGRPGRGGARIAAHLGAGRWSELMDAAAQLARHSGDAGRSPARGVAAEPAAPPFDPGADQALRDALQARTETAERQGRAQRRRAEAAETQIARLRAALTAALEDAEGLRAEVARLQGTIADEQARTRTRLARLRRQRAAAEDACRRAEARLAAVTAGLEQQARDRAAAGPDTVAAGAPGAGAPTGQDSEDGAEVVAEPGTTGVAVPRGVVPAQPGRPCRIPAGLDPEQPVAVRSLLACPGLQVLVDGYNVTKDPAGAPTASLPEQRRWLLALAAGVAGRFGRWVTLVYDGTEPEGPASGRRHVRVVFSAGEETADERILALLELLGAQVPVLVVTSDAALRAACEAHGANVVGAAAFVRAVGGSAVGDSAAGWGRG